jgi:hypothetical protein
MVREGRGEENRRFTVKEEEKWKRRRKREGGPGFLLRENIFLM